MSIFMLNDLLYKSISKKILSLIIIAILFINISFAATKRWTGNAGDGAWSTPSNWNGNTVPSVNDDVVLNNIFVNGSYVVKLPATLVVVKTVTISPSSGNTIQLTLPSTNLLTPGFIISGPGYGLVINNGGIFKDSSGAPNMSPVDISDSIKINNGGKFVHATPRSHTNNVTVLSTAPGTEKGIFEFDVPGTQSYTLSLSNRIFGTLMLSANAALGSKNYTGKGSNPVTMNGDLQLNAGVNFNTNLATADGNIIVNGNFIQNAGTFNVASGADISTLKIKGNITQTAGAQITTSTTGFPIIELNGTVSQNILMQGTITNAVGFKMNNAAGAVLLAPLSLPYNLNLANGNITTTSTNLLTLQNGTTVTVDTTIANKSFINGPLRKENLSASPYFFFPVGKGSTMRWIELKNATGNFIIEFIKSDPRSLSTNYSTGIDHISANDYWTINADASPVAKANVELSFANATTSGVTDMSALRVAQLSSGSWVDKSNTATTGTAGASGSVVSSVINVFGPVAQNFTLASNTSTQNPLPVKLISFSGSLINNNTQLNWQIDSPDDVDHFTIMFSSDNKNFKNIDSVNAEALQTSYQFIDKQLNKGINYYRLKIIQKDGSFYYSNVITINSSDFAFGIHFTSFNLVTSNIEINITSEEQNKMQLLIISADGKIIKHINIETQHGNNVKMLDLSGLGAGLYYLIGQNKNAKTNVLRFIKQ